MQLQKSCVSFGEECTHIVKEILIHVICTFRHCFKKMNDIVQPIKETTLEVIDSVLKYCVVQFVLLLGSVILCEFHPNSGCEAPEWSPLRSKLLINQCNFYSWSCILCLILGMGSVGL